MSKAQSQAISEEAEQMLDKEVSLRNRMVLCQLRLGEAYDRFKYLDRNMQERLQS